MTANAAALAALRVTTAAFIADDPTIITLTTSSRVKTASGGYADIAGVVREPQVVKLVQLNHDQRPTITVSGVERVADFHVVGHHTLAIAVGDTWVDDQGTTWEVIGFSEGWDHMTKAFAGRHIPRTARP